MGTLGGKDGSGGKTRHLAKEPVWELTLGGAEGGRVEPKEEGEPVGETDCERKTRGDANRRKIESSERENQSKKKVPKKSPKAQKGGT